MDIISLATSLETAQVGDTVVIVRHGEARTTGTVHKVTKARLTVKNDSSGSFDEYHRNDGWAVGSRTGTYSRCVRAAKDLAEVEALQEAVRQRDHAQQQRKHAEREALRGTMLGYLVAAKEALDAVQGDNEMAMQLSGLLHDTTYKLKNAMEHVTRCAEALRRMATEMEDNMKREVTYQASTYGYVTEHREADALRGKALEQAQLVLGLVAAYVGVEKKELMARMAKG